MPRITHLQINRGMVAIDLDGVFWLRIAQKYFQRCPLSLNDALDPDEYLMRVAALQAPDCYEAALTLLDRADHASADLCARLMRKGFVRPVAEATVERLNASGLIDDERYALRLAQAQLNRNAGAFAVRRKLMAKRLSADAVESAMAGFDVQQQQAACLGMAQKLWKKYAALPPREGRTKLAQALARRGFSWDAVHSAMDTLCPDWEDPC